MHKRRNSTLLLSCFVLCLIASGCNSSSKKTAGGLQFTFPKANPLIEPGQSVTLAVNEAVTWTIQNGTGFGQPVGQLTNETTTAATYVAPALATPPSCSDSAAPPTALQVTVTATSTADTTQSAVMLVTIVQAPPCIATAPTYTTCPPAGTVIVPASTQIFQTGVFQQINVDDGGSQNQTPFGVPPFTWSIASGSLPNGLSIASAPNSSSISIQGTPVTSGCSSATLQITDATGLSSSQAFGFVVIPLALKVQVPRYSDAYVNASTNAGIPYTPTAVTVSGGIPPYLWAYQSANPLTSFPGGLCLSSSVSNVPSSCVSSSPPAGSNVGIVWGTPSADDLLTEQNNGGSYSTQLLVSDSQQPYPAVARPSLSMTVYPLQPACPSAPDIQPSTLNGGVTGAGLVAANSYLQGPLAFLVQGFDANGPVVIAGSVTLDGNGGVTSGVEDVTRSTGSSNLTILPGGSSYSVGGSLRLSALGGPSAVYNRGCLTLADSGGTTTTFAIALGGCSNSYTEGGIVATHDNACGMKQNNQSQNVAAGTFTTGRIMEFDDSTGTGTRGSGILRLQNSSTFSNSSLSGLYAFGLAGQDSAGGHYAMAGSTQASSGSLSSAAADIDDAGTLASQLTGGSGTYSISSNGRGTATLTLGSTSLDLALYMVSGNEAIAITTDPLSASHPIAAGEAIMATGPFSFSSLQYTHIFHIGGVASSGPDVSVGVMSFDGVGGVGGTVYEDQVGTLGTTTLAGAYSVDGNTGRTVFSAPNVNQTLGSHPFVAYLTAPPTGTRSECSQPASCVTGFLVGIDSTAQDGVLEFQTSAIAPPPPFGKQFVAGDYFYGTAESLDTATTIIDGTLSSDTANLNSATQNANYASAGYCLQPGCLLLVPNQTLSNSTFTVNSDGTGTFGPETVSVTNGTAVFYIDESPLDLHPSIIVTEQ